MKRPYLKTLEPIKPQEYMDFYEPIHDFGEVSEYSILPLNDVLKKLENNEVYYLKVNALSCNDYSSDVHLIVCKMVSKKNPNYSKQLKQYETQKKEHDKNAEEYNKLLQEYESEQKKIAENQELKLYQKLKKKYEKR